MKSLDERLVEALGADDIEQLGDLEDCIEALLGAIEDLKARNHQLGEECAAKTQRIEGLENLLLFAGPTKDVPPLGQSDTSMQADPVIVELQRENAELADQVEKWKAMYDELQEQHGEALLAQDNWRAKAAEWLTEQRVKEKWIHTRYHEAGYVIGELRYRLLNNDESNPLNIKEALRGELKDLEE